MCITRVSFLFSFISFYLLEYRMQGIYDAIGNKNERHLNNKLESEFKRLSSEKQYLNNSWPLSDAREICSDGRGSRYRIFLAKGYGGSQLPFFRRRPARFVERVCWIGKPLFAEWIRMWKRRITNSMACRKAVGKMWNIRKYAFDPVAS